MGHHYLLVKTWSTAGELSIHCPPRTFLNLEKLLRNIWSARGQQDRSIRATLQKVTCHVRLYLSHFVIKSEQGTCWRYWPPNCWHFLSVQLEAGLFVTLSNKGLLSGGRRKPKPICELFYPVQINIIVLNHEMI